MDWKASCIKKRGTGYWKSWKPIQEGKRLRVHLKQGTFDRSGLDAGQVWDCWESWNLHRVRWPNFEWAAQSIESSKNCQIQPRTQDQRHGLQSNQAFSEASSERGSTFQYLIELQSAIKQKWSYVNASNRLLDAWKQDNEIREHQNEWLSVAKSKPSSILWGCWRILRAGAEAGIG